MAITSPTANHSRYLEAFLAVAGMSCFTSGQGVELINRYQLSWHELAELTPQVQQILGLDNAERERCLRQAERTVAMSVKWQSQESDRHIIALGSECYPSALDVLTHPPVVLFVRGCLTPLLHPLVAMVGSRSASVQGMHTATQLAAHLSQLGIGVISGLASGIDAAAHKGAMAELGKTIAVMGTGPDTIYPAKNACLANQIVAHGGCVVTEFAPLTPAKKYHFPRRNRIIAALGMGTVVVEAKIRSGTLITANLAADLGKEVFAVPGHIANPQVEGCHYLIQQGAKLTTSVRDIVDELRFDFDINDKGAKKNETNNLATDPLLDSVDYDVTEVNIIAERNGIEVSEVLSLLLEYELRGLVAAVPGGYVKLRGK